MYYRREEEDSPRKEVHQIKEEMKMFTIGNILQVKPKIYHYYQNDHNRDYEDQSIREED